MNEKQEQQKETVGGGHSGSIQQKQEREGWNSTLIAIGIIIAIATLIVVFSIL